MSHPDTGLYIGTVEDNTIDRDGCIGIKIPALGGTFPARLTAPMAGDARGMVFLPEKNDQVLVAAVLGSDVRWAVIGSVWSRNEKPPVTNGDGKNDTKIIKTRGGNVIRMTDTDNDERIEITDKTGTNTISIGTKNNEITIKAAGAVSIKGKTVTLEATNGDVTVTGQKIYLN
jgi:uncharacterized protein involved in type VI secretion and phage assembly